MYNRGREELIGMKQQNSPFSPITLQNRGQDFQLDDSMDEGITSGIIFSHACHHSYLEEAMVQQGDFHLHLLSFRKVHHSGLHTWEETLEDSFIATYLEQ